MMASDRLEGLSSPGEFRPDRAGGSILGNKNDTSHVCEVEQE